MSFRVEKNTRPLERQSRRELRKEVLDAYEVIVDMSLVQESLRLDVLDAYEAIVAISGGENP